MVKSFDLSLTLPEQDTAHTDTYPHNTVLLAEYIIVNWRDLQIVKARWDNPHSQLMNLKKKGEKKVEYR